MKFFVGFLLITINLSAYAAANNTQILRIHGSNTIGAKLVPQLVKDWLHTKGFAVLKNKQIAKEEKLMTAFDDQGNELKVEIHAYGSSTAFADLAAGSTDLGMSSRPIKAKEIQKLKFLGRLDAPGSEFVIALDGLAIIVHPQNPLRQLQKNILKDIFSGKIADWSELELPKGKINIYARDNNSGTYDTFRALVLGKKTPLISGAKRFASNARLSEAVSKDTNAIGFVGLAYIGKSKALAVADSGASPMFPIPFYVGTEDYVLSRRLFLYVPSNDPHPLAVEFAEFAETKSAQDKAEQVGFVSQNIIANRFSIPKDAPEEYKTLIRNAERLSLNIRFRPGYTILDNKALRDVDRLIDFMSQEENRDRKLMLFGFADAKEELPYASLSLSINRADAVADYLLKKGVAPHRIRGYGQEMPVTNNETDRGRHYNRRVELWIQ